jgi:N-acetylglucosamine kinase-like BadF-type ATPase
MTAPDHKILIADSGATKTDWCLLSSGTEPRFYKTSGFNPYYQSSASILAKLRDEWAPQWDLQNLQTIYFYGSGCATADRASIVETPLRSFFEADHVEVNSDLLGAARASCGKHPGIACILGTGSGSCAFDGKHISDKIPSLGFILGDEGSGAYLGKMLITDFLRGNMPVKIQKELYKTHAVDKETVLETINKNEMPSRYLAGFAKFISIHLDEPYIFDLAYRGFQAFAEDYIVRYKRYEELPVHFVGSVAYFNMKVIQQLSRDMDFHIGKIIKAPMDGLVKYHKIQP